MSILLKDAPKDILAMLDKMGKRTKDKSFINGLIVRLCRWKFLKASEIAIILAKSEKWVLREYITLLIQAGELQYTIPDMKNHPDQAYIASAKE